MDKNQRTIEEEKMNLREDLRKIVNVHDGKKTKLSPNTIDMYIKKINQMENDLDENPLSFVYDNQNGTDFIEFLQNTYTTNAQNYFSPIITVFTKIPKYKKMLKPKTITRMKKAMLEGISGAENKQYAKTKNEPLKITWKEYVDAVNNLDTSKFSDTEILMLRLYTEIQARDNFGKLLMQPDEDGLDNDQNYYIMDSGKVVLNKYKTAQKFGRKVFTISNDLKNFVDVMIENMNNGKNVNQEYLIARKNGNLYTKGELSSQFRKLTNKLVDKPISINDIRRAKITDVLDKKSTTLSDRKQLASDMMNSLKMQTEVYERKGKAE